MVPLSKLHKHISVPIWYLSIFIFFIGSIFLISKILTAEDKKMAPCWAFYALVILTSLRFLLSVVQRVQSDCLVLFLLSLFIYALYRRREVSAGLSLAAAVMVKLTPLIIIPYLLLRKRIKATASCLLSILAFAFIPALYLGWGRNLQYLKSFLLVHKTNPPEYIIWYKNQSLLSALMRFLRLEPLKIYIIFLVLALILFSLIFLVRRQKRGLAPFGKKGAWPLLGFAYLREISLVLILMILLSPLGWKHTFVHLVIVHLLLLYYLFYINPQDKVTKGLFIASFIMNTVLNPEITGPFAQTVQLYSSVTLGTLLLYVALLRINADANNNSHI